jgi:hypothetical protein
MVAGGNATGQIVFEVSVEEGHQWVIWKPNAFNAGRAIVQINSLNTYAKFSVAINIFVILYEFSLKANTAYLLPHFPFSSQSSN